MEYTPLPLFWVKKTRKIDLPLSVFYLPRSLLSRTKIYSKKSEKMPFGRFQKCNTHSFYLLDCKKVMLLHGNKV